MADTDYLDFEPDIPLTSFDPVHAEWITRQLQRLADSILSVGDMEHVTEHNELGGRDAVDCHPQGAVTDLVDDQAAQDGRLTTLEGRADETDTEQATQDTELGRLEAEKADIAAVVDTFVFSSYLALTAPNNTAFADLDGTWQDLDFITDEGTLPHWMVNEGNGQFSFPYEGVYFFYTSGSMEHIASNSGRITNLRLYNYTDGLGADGMAIGTGRNQEATSINANVIFTVDAALVNKTFGLQMGGGDGYTGVNFQVMGFGVFNIGVWQYELGST